MNESNLPLPSSAAHTSPQSAVLSITRLQLYPQRFYNAPQPTLSVQLGPGCHSVVAPTALDADLFIGAVSGLLPAPSGQVKLSGQDPASSPSIRRRIATLLAEEPAIDESFPLPRYLRKGATPLSQLCAQLCRSHASQSKHKLPQLPPAQLARLQRELADIWESTLEQLTNHERRRVILQLALAADTSQALLLFEPWTALQPSDENSSLGQTLEVLADQAHGGRIVVIVTLSKSMASRLSEQPLHLLQPSTTRKRA